jgi:hypothetical protein
MLPKHAVEHEVIKMQAKQKLIEMFVVCLLYSIEAIMLINARMYR